MSGSADSTSHRLTVVTSNEFDAEGSDLLPRVSEGKYHLKLLERSTKIMFSTPRLILKFSIVDLGEFHGVVLYRYYGVDSLIGKYGKNGRFKAKQTGDFLIEYCNLFPNQRITRLDRIPMEKMYNEIIIGKVRTVKINNKQRKLPEQLQHSVIGELLGTEK